MCVKVVVLRRRPEAQAAYDTPRETRRRELPRPSGGPDYRSHDFSLKDIRLVDYMRVEEVFTFPSSGMFCITV